MQVPRAADVIEITARMKPAGGAASRCLQPFGLAAPLGHLGQVAANGTALGSVNPRVSLAVVLQLLPVRQDGCVCFSLRFESRVLGVSDSVVQRLRFCSISGDFPSSQCGRPPAGSLGRSESYDIGGAFLENQTISTARLQQLPQNQRDCHRPLVEQTILA